VVTGAAGAFALTLAGLVGAVLALLWLRRAVLRWLGRALDLKCPQCGTRVNGDEPACDNGHALDEAGSECV
jgi:hypothetical protein